MCRNEHLNYLRDPRVAGPRVPAAPGASRSASTRQAARAPGRRGPDEDGIHQALLAGLLSHIGLRDRRARATTWAPAAPGSRSSRGSALSRKQPAAGHGRRAGRDLAALRPGQRRDRARSGPSGSGPPGEAHLQRAALVAQAGRGHGPRAGHPLRRPARRRPAGHLRHGSTRSWPASCSSGTRSCRASGRPDHRFFARQPGAAGGGRGARAPRPPARHRRRRADPLRLLRRAGRPRRRLRRALRLVVEAGARSDARPAHLRPARCSSTRPRGEVSRGGLPRRVAGEAAHPPALLPLRARRRGRRRHRRPAAGHPQPADRRRAVVAGPGAPRGPGRRAAPVAAEAAAGQLRAGAEPRAGVPGRGRTRGGAAARRPGAATCAPAPASTCPARPGTGPRCRRTCGRPTASSARTATVVSTGKDLVELKAPLADRFAEALGDAAAEQIARPASGAGRSETVAALVRAAPRRATRSRGTPRSSTRVTTVGLRVFGRSATRRPLTAGACDGCWR